MKLFTGRQWLRNLALLLGLGIFFLVDVEAMATTNKETPLTNLAAGKMPTLPNGQPVTNGQLVTDGDKYGDVVLNNSTKSYPADATKNMSVNWNSLGPVADIGNEAYLQLDLEGEYSIEVINLKRRWRNQHGSGNIANTPKGHEFQNTAIVLATQPDFSDAKVIYYQNESDIKGHLPNANIVATKQSPTYNETYGGTWFYVAGDGITPTAPQTVVKARYIRVYSDKPASTTFGTAENGFVELAVYGYKEESRKAEAVRTKRKIDAENPLFIVPCYSSNYYDIGQQEEPEFKGNETISGRWNTTPEHLKKYHVLLAHTDNLGMVGGQQFADNHAVRIDRQRLLQEFYEHCLKIGYTEQIPVMLMGITASAQPVVYNDNNTVKYSATRYNITAMMDYGWLDLMYRMYPNMEGTFNTENHWSRNFGGVAEGSGNQLNIAARHNGYFAWTERSDTLDNAEVTGNTTWTTAVKNNGDHLYMMYKSTGAVGGQEYATQSYMQGLWLGGYADGWGGLIDTWAWSNVNQGPLGTGTGGGAWAQVVAYPENMLGIGLLSMYLEGACIYTMEHPNYTYGVDDKNSPAYTHAVVEAMNFIVSHPAPTKKEILERTKVLVYGRGANIYSGLVGDTGRNYFLYDTSRYGSLPVIADWNTKDEISERISRVCAQYGIEVPLLLDVSDPILGGSRIPFFEEKYPLEYEGNAFADIWNNDWYVYNNEYDPNQIDAGQTVTLPLVSGDNDTIRLKTSDLKAHTYFVVDQQVAGDKIELYLNNYRTDKTKVLVTRNILGVEFHNNDLKMASDQRSCLGLEQYVRVSTQNPDDGTLRKTTWELTRLTEKPTVRIVDAQEWTGSSSPQVSFNEGTDVQFDPLTGKATISIETNGWVKLELSNLKFETDSAAGTGGVVQPRVNVASGGGVKLSSQRDASGRPASRFTDENTAKAQYVELEDGAQWAQVDMGGLHKVEEVQLWRYWGEPDARSYKDTVILLSSDANFDPAKTLVLWNSCTNPSGVTWPTASTDGTVTNNVTIPVGKQSNYAEKEAGKSFSVTAQEAEWLDQSPDRPKPTKHFEAQYIRVYQNGRADVNTAHNHLVEIKAWGERGPVQITDNVNPSTPVDLQVKSVDLYSAELTFAASTDNTGVKDYTLTVTPDHGSSSQTINQTTISLNGLQPGTKYQVLLVANDNHGNSSAPAEIEFTTLTEITVDADVPSGQYPSEKEVTLTATDSTAEIYYTTDGTLPLDSTGTPAKSALLYSTPIKVGKGMVITAAARKDGKVHPAKGWFYLIGESINGLEIPTAPNGIQVKNVSAQQVTLSWTGTDPSAPVFKVYLNGELKYTGNAVETTITGLTPLTAYQIYVTSMDEQGNESLRSETIEVITIGQ